MVGNDMKPLSISMEHSQKDEGESGMTIWSPLIIESTVLEISLSSVGIITTKLITNGETIVQATKSAPIPNSSSSVGELLSVPCSSSVASSSRLTSKREYSNVIPSVCGHCKQASVNSFHDGLCVKRGI